jgi:hypothetical protein
MLIEGVRWRGKKKRNHAETKLAIYSKIELLI